MIAWRKVPSTPANQADGVFSGIEELCRPLNEIDRIVHGTTVGTNAIIERRGAKVGLMTTAGFKDLIEIGRTQRLVPNSMFKPKFIRPRPLVPRYRRFEVKERMLAPGKILKRMESHQFDDLVEKITAADVDAIAICFIHSYRNPDHEIQARDCIRKRLPLIPISISSEVVPEYREFERFSTTVVNAYLTPVMLNYLESLRSDLSESGYRHRLFVMNSSGGMITAEIAQAFPIRTILSGPAGGVNGAIHFASQASFSNIITCDMGGTSTDVCLVQNLIPAVSSEHQLSAIPIKTPQMEINTVGAGGGSIAWVDEDMRLKVGPRSAGADPGPASYGKGGRHPTVTDANLFLGRLGAKPLLGEKIRLIPELAADSIQRLAKKLDGYEPYKLAEGIIQIAMEKMAGSIKEISVQRGHDPRDYVLVPYGGSGPMHAAQIGEALGISTILIPPIPGNLSALGLTVSDVRHDDVDNWMNILERVKVEDLENRFKKMEKEAASVLLKEGFHTGKIVMERSLDLRYRGQAFELNIPVRAGDSLDEMKINFDQRFQERYGHGHPGHLTELVNLRVSSFGIIDKPHFSPQTPEQGAIDQAKRDENPVFFDGTFRKTAILKRNLLPCHESIHGPAIIEESGATTVVPPGWAAAMDIHGNLVLNKRRSQ